MSKINRYDGNLKAFASEQLTEERTTFGTENISDDLTDQITPEFLRGWGIIGPSGFPSIQDFSAAQFTATQLIAYLHQMGVPEWNETQEYPTAGATCIHSGVQWYRKSTWTLGDEPGVSSSWRAGVLTISSVFDTAGFDNLEVGTVVNLVGYHDDTTVGGGTGVGKNARHNGGTAISKTRTRPTDWADQAQLAAWFLDSGVDELCAVRTDIDSINISMFGAKGDFDPSTGLGADDRQPIQATVNYLTSIGGGKLTTQDGGKYYLGPNYEEAGNIAAQVIIGSQTGTPSSLNIHLNTAGSKFYQGAAGRAFLLANAEDCSWTKPYVIGYTGGTLEAGRENDAPIMINKNCRNIEIYGHYITNSLGDCITVQAAVDEAGGGLGNESNGISIHHGVLKERYGDGVPSHSGGTRSREALAVIVGNHVDIHHNLIFGSVDFEPNLNDQVLFDVQFRSNRLSAGKVLPQTVIGTDYWHDEPLSNSEFAALLNNDIKLQGIAGAPIIAGVVCDDNYIDNGQILSGREYEFDSVSNNRFNVGSIVLGNDDGIGYMRKTVVHNNTCGDVIAGRSGFIEINGQVADSKISDNFLRGAGYCVNVGSNVVGPVFDGGNYFSNNIAASGQHYDGVYNPLSVRRSLEKVENSNYAPQVVIGFAGVTNTLSYTDFYGESWYLQQASGVATSLSEISNSLGDGQVLEIMAEASGGGSLTIIHSAAIKLKGSVDAVLGNAQTVTLRRNFGRWVEVSRNF